jgi:hypothetical protein
LRPTRTQIEQADALDIAKKIGCEVKPDGAHKRALLYLDGQLILQFGIRHGKKSKHGHLCGSNGDLKLNEIKVKALARCTLSKDEYFEILRSKGIIP